MRRNRWRSAVVVGAFVAAACSSGGSTESATPTVELSTTTVTTLPPTTEVVTTEAPTTTEDPRIAEVEAAVAAFRETQLRVLLDPTAPIDDLASVATGVLLENNMENILKVRAEGQVFSGDFDERSISTELVSSEAAVHTACGLDGLSALSPDGEVLEDPDETALLRQYSLQLDEAKGWLVILVAFVGTEATPCEV